MALGKFWEKIVGNEKEFPALKDFHGTEESARNLKGKGTSENPYGDTEIIDDEKERLNRNDPMKRYVPIENVADNEAEEAVYANADEAFRSQKDLAETYDPEIDFARRALKVLDATEFNTLFSFLKKIDEGDMRKDYLGYKDDEGEFIPPARQIPRDITNLIKKVNSFDRPQYMESAEFDENGNVIKQERILTSQVNRTNKKKKPAGRKLA